MKTWPIAAMVLFPTLAFAGPKPAVQKLHGLIVMTPSPTQAPPPGLRMRTMVRPADDLWIGPTPPAHVPLSIGHGVNLDLLDATKSGGLVAVYRENLTDCSERGPWVNCSTTVKIFDKSQKEAFSLPLDGYLSRKDHLEVQDVRFVESAGGGTLYFNEACQTYSKDAGGKCSSLVAVDVASKKLLWRSEPLVSNNHFLVIGNYLVAAYGFTAEQGFIRVVRRSDGKVTSKQALRHNFEMSLSADVLDVQMYYTDGTAHFRVAGFDGDAPTLTALPTTPPNPNEKPKPYDPPLFPKENAKAVF
jgi:hypothetical protein